MNQLPAPVPTPAPAQAPQPVKPTETALPVEQKPPVMPSQTPNATPTPIDTAKIEAQNQAKLQQEAQKQAIVQQTEQKKQEAMIPKTSDAIYQALVSGQQVAPQRSGAYNEAMFKFNQYKRMSAMTPNEMTTALKSGKV